METVATKKESARKEEKVSQVEKQTNVLLSQIATLHEEIITLHNNLNKVLKPPAPESEGNVDKPDGLVPFAETIRDAADSVEIINYSVRDILERLEV